MKNNLSVYEEKQVSRFLYELYLLWSETLEESECIGEGWIVYLDGKEKYQYDIGDVDYWDYVQTNVKEKFADLKRIRNEKISLESRMSLNQRIPGTEEEIGIFFPGKTGNFENSIVLWDYAKRLGSLKYAILRLMCAREEDYDIQHILHLSEEEYYRLKRELRNDFLNYVNCQ